MSRYNNLVSFKGDYSNLMDVLFIVSINYRAKFMVCQQGPM